MKNALIFVMQQEKVQVPMMLKEILFKPLLQWAAEALTESGVEHFYLFCAEDFHEQAQRCMPDTVQVKLGTDLTETQEFFAQGETAVITRPVLLTKEGMVHIPNAAQTSVVYKTCDHCFKEITTGACLPEGVVGIWSVSDDRERHVVQEKICHRIIEQHIDRGVSFLDPKNVYIMPEVQIGQNTTILPGVILRGNTKIGENCEIGPNSMINNCIVGNSSVINASQLNDSVIGENTKVGPFAYVRPNCEIGSDVKLGDFVEVKNSVIGDGTKISHLTYVGDSDIGKNVNLGCGTVTVNYDGKKKFRTRLEDNVFVGCNTNLIAPVTIHSHAYIAAGSTITDDVPEHTLAIARERQIIKENWKK